MRLVSFLQINHLISYLSLHFFPDRIESYDYKHSQLFLATLFFSSLLFLLPTVIVYYVVFSAVSSPVSSSDNYEVTQLLNPSVIIHSLTQVRLGIYCIIFTLLLIRRQILQLPVYDLVRYLTGIHIGPGKHHNQLNLNLRYNMVIII